MGLQSLNNAGFGETLSRTLPGSVWWSEARSPEMRSDTEIAVEFRVLGPLEAVVAGGMVRLGTPKQRVLLALLVSQVGQPVAVDVIVEALWAGHPPPSAVNSLQAYVANLRKVLEPARARRSPTTVLHTCPQGYLLDSRVVDVDVRRFGEHATTGWQAWDRGDPQQALNEFEAGLGLWRGQAYADVAGALCVMPEVARLDTLRLSVVEARCAALLAVGAHEVAVVELEAFVRTHPLREYGCELLMLALYRAGRQADALNVLRTVQTQMGEELGINPGPALKEIEWKILNQFPALDWQPIPTVSAAGVVGRPTAAPSIDLAGPPPSPPAGGGGFVGREAALRQLADELAAAADGGRVVTVSGEQGIGKSSLLRRFAEQTEVPVLWGTCPKHVAAPALWPWKQVLRAAGACFPHRPVPGPIADLVEGGDLQLVDDVHVAGPTLQLFEAIVRYLTDESAPLVVLFDHFHRADPSSLRLLAHLAESVQTSRLLLAVAYESDEAAPLAETLAALARTEMASIELSGLDTRETHILASAVLRRDVSWRTAAELRDRSEGHPFFLRELIKQMIGERGLDQPRAVPVPVREVVLQRVARLPHTAAEILSVAAVAGRHFDIEVVADAASVEIEAALKGLEAAVGANLIVEDEHQLGWFRFAHALVAETLYGATGPLRRARLHHRIGAAVAREWNGQAERAPGITRHWQMAAEPDPTAVIDADPLLTPDDAAVSLQQALAAADMTEEENLDWYPRLVGLHSFAHRAGRFQHRLPRFIHELRETLAADDAHYDPNTSRLIMTAIAAIREQGSRPAADAETSERLVDILERTLSTVTDPVQRALVLSCLAVARYYDGDPPRRAALSDKLA